MKTEAPKIRSWHPTSAALRVGGPMKDRRAPRGGASNEGRDLLDEFLAEEAQDEDHHEKETER